MKSSVETPLKPLADVFFRGGKEKGIQGEKVEAEWLQLEESSLLPGTVRLQSQGRQKGGQKEREKRWSKKKILGVVFCVNSGY